jgi:hypothetical protein
VEWKTTEVTFDFLVAANYVSLIPVSAISEALTIDWWNLYVPSGITTISNLVDILNNQGLMSNLLRDRFYAINPGNFDRYPYWQKIPVFGLVTSLFYNQGYFNLAPAPTSPLNVEMTMMWYLDNITPELPMTLDEYWQIVLDDLAANLAWYYRLRAMYNPFNP